jgi:glycosyltransferase involved in cell wall biosynthesis
MSNINPVVSVVVPFYNIEECVSYCVESLLSQTFSDYEIICIDDGSTDATLSRLMDYSGDERIHVLHKSNGGLSNARNYGLLHSRGRFISFVDGDDFVAPNYLESLYSALHGKEDSLAVGSVLLVNELDIGTTAFGSSTNTTSKEITNKEYLRKLMYETILPGAWARMGSRSIYEKSPFPEGKAYEEIATAANFALSAKHIFLSGNSCYGYVMRPGSIVHRKVARFGQAQDYLSAIDSFTDLTTKFFLKDSNEQIFFHSLHYSRLFRLLDVVLTRRDEVEDMQQMIRRYVRNNLVKLMKDGNVSLGNKVRFLLLSSSPRLFRLLFNFYNKLNRGM